MSREVVGTESQLPLLGQHCTPLRNQNWKRWLTWLGRCLIGPIENARNEVPVPSLETGAPIQVGDVIAIEGNTEVYTFARTSGYSLGFTSDVPGVQRFRGRWTREWTVRRYAQVQGTSGRPTRRGPRQTLREW